MKTNFQNEEEELKDGEEFLRRRQQRVWVNKEKCDSIKYSTQNGEPVYVVDVIITASYQKSVTSQQGPCL